MSKSPTTQTFTFTMQNAHGQVVRVRAEVELGAVLERQVGYMARKLVPRASGSKPAQKVASVAGGVLRVWLVPEGA